MIEAIGQIVEATPFADTHEHLWDESTRLRLAAQGKFPSDFSAFFFGYPASDLQSAGLSGNDWNRIVGTDMTPRDKWRLIAPHYRRAWHTGYMRNVRESVRALTGEEDLRAENCQQVSDSLAALLKPGHYEHVLRRIANIAHCQVASLEAHVFHQTESPSLLYQDFHMDPLCLGRSFLEGDAFHELARAAGRESVSLADWHGVIDWHFAQYGPRAVAIKHASAYDRGLDYARVPFEDAAPLFERFLREPKGLTCAENKALQDHLFHYCVEKSKEYRLPIKMHTGYHAGVYGMPLRRVRDNLGDLCPIFHHHHDARFVVFHMAYPYENEAKALAKHYPNVYVDLCWAWIIDPRATIRFVKDFLLTAPANKLLCFGGDYWNLEGVPGHAVIARRGLTQALSELVAEDWISGEDAIGLAPQLMRDNAAALFNYTGARTFNRRYLP